MSTAVYCDAASCSRHAIRRRRQVSQRLETIEKERRALGEEAESTSNPLRKMQIVKERIELADLALLKRGELQRLDSELPPEAEGDGAADGLENVVVAESGDICMKRHRSAPFGWLQVCVLLRGFHSLTPQRTHAPQMHPHGFVATARSCVRQLFCFVDPRHTHLRPRPPSFHRLRCLFRARFMRRWAHSPCGRVSHNETLVGI